MLYILNFNIIIDGQKYTINELNIWDYDWQFMQYTYIKKCFFSTPIRKNVYYIKDQCKYAIFSATEISNNIWEITTLSQQSKNENGERLKKFG